MRRVAALALLVVLVPVGLCVALVTAMAGVERDDDEWNWHHRGFE